MTNEPKVALCLIVKGDDREAVLLDRCLSGKVTNFATPNQRDIDLEGVGSLADAVDGIFITITQPNDKVKEVAEKYGATVSEYEWEFNFAKARNFNFSQVPEEYEYIFWVDSDDVVRNPHLIRPIAKKSKEQAVDAVVLNYLYDWDEDGNCEVKHLKTRMVRNDGCVSWAGAIHEDFAHNRQISADLNKEIEILHLTDPKRIDDSARRNKYISEKAVETNPEDPRTFWNLANTYFLVGNIEDAIKIYLQFLQVSKSDEERYLSWHRLAACYAGQGDFDNAMEAAYEAFGLRPWYPDPYFMLGEINFKAGNMKAAAELIEMGLTKNIPELESIVWNPMDYDYYPHLVLAQVYFSTDRPRDAVKHFKKCLEMKPKSVHLKKVISEVEKEIPKFDKADEIYKKAFKLKDKKEIKKLLDEVPEDMKYYPAIVSLRNTHFVKEESSGKDVVIYCGYTSQEWTPEVADTAGVGGSEEAVIQLAKRWQENGWHVTVYANTPGHQEYEFDGVKWVPFESWNHKDKQDVLIIWRHPKALDYNLNAERVYIDMHDVIPSEEFTTARLKSVTKILFKSNTQRNNYPNVPDNKCAVIPHGLDIEEFDSLRDSVEKNPYVVLNTSSPDRSLKTCMKIMNKVHDRLGPEIRDKIQFKQYYGFDVWDGDFSDDDEMIQWKDDALIRLNDMKSYGLASDDSGKRLSQREITKRYLEAGILLYPSEFFEIGFISGIKGALAGALPFTTDAFAQGEFLSGGVIVRSDANYENWTRDIKTGIDYGVQEESQINEFVEKIVDYMNNPEKYEEQRQKMINYARETFNWDKTAQSWINEWTTT